MSVYIALELARGEQRHDHGKRDPAECAKAEIDRHPRATGLVHAVQHGPRQNQSADLVEDKEHSPDLQENAQQFG